MVDKLQCESITKYVLTSGLDARYILIINTNLHQVVNIDRNRHRGMFLIMQYIKYIFLKGNAILRGESGISSASNESIMDTPPKII